MQQNKGLIILNLGSPDSYEVKDVRRYLDEFLMDERVMDISPFFRTMLVKGFINPFRAPKSAEAYKSIWTHKGSPLKVITEEFCKLVQPRISIPAVVSMRYANPNPAETLRSLEEKVKDLREILVAPMYPHYAMSSYETAVKYLVDYIQSVRKDISFRILKPFFNEPAYIASLAACIQPYLNEPYDAILFSYHGLPVRHLKKTDPTHSHCYSSTDCCEIKSAAWQYCYKHQVKATTKLVAEQLKLEPSKVMISFQSRIGSGWIEPFTDKVIDELPSKGVKKLLVLCPAFVADCLETLEEISMRAKESFLQNGGETFVNIPCLNTNPKWVDTFADWCNGYEDKYATLWS